MLEIERAQRSVLKTIFKKPFRFPTVDLFSLANVLSVRQLFIYKICLQTHKSSKLLMDYNLISQKRVFNLPIPRVRTGFGKRFGERIRASTYNTVNKYCILKDCSHIEAKKLVFNLLHSKNYAETEDMLDIIL
jgi:hypothetical protein